MQWTSGISWDHIVRLLRRESTQLWLLMLFVLAINLRGMINYVSIDEGGQIKAAEGSIATIVTQFHAAQNHPFYGLLAHGMIVHSPLPIVWAARFPAFVAGLLLTWLFYRGRARWVGHEAAVLATFLLVLADPVHHYSTAARGYAFLMLGSLVLADLLTDYLERGGPWRWAGYVAVATLTTYSHLWTLPVLAAHAAFVALEALRPRPERPPRERLVAVLAAIALATALAALFYAPLIPAIVAAGRRVPGPMIDRLVEALFQLVRYGSWTVAAFVLFVPIVLEGLARRTENPLDDRRVRLHLTVVACPILLAMLFNPLNFGSRFLLGIAPSGSALVAWALAGYWRGTGECERLPLLPTAASFLVGFALGVFVGNAKLAHEIPPGSNGEIKEDYQGNYFRMLPKETGNPAAAGILVLGLAGLAARRRLPRLCGVWAQRVTRLAVVFWTLVLVASMVPLVLGPYAFRPRALFEVHMLAVGAAALLAWQHRFETKTLLSLRYALVGSILIAALWLAGLPFSVFDAKWLLRLFVPLPPLMVAAALARTTRCPG